MAPIPGDKKKEEKSPPSLVEVLLSEGGLRQKLAALYAKIASEGSRAGQLLATSIFILILLMLMADRYIFGSEFVSAAIHKFINTEKRVAEAIQKISFYSYGTSLNVISTGEIRIKSGADRCSLIDLNTRTIDRTADSGYILQNCVDIGYSLTTPDGMSVPIYAENLQSVQFVILLHQYDLKKDVCEVGAAVGKSLICLRPDRSKKTEPGALKKHFELRINGVILKDDWIKDRATSFSISDQNDSSEFRSYGLEIPKSDAEDMQRKQSYHIFALTPKVGHPKNVSSHVYILVMVNSKGA